MLAVSLLLMGCVISEVASRTVLSSDSILDMINTEEVEKILAERKENDTKDYHRFIEHNGLDDEDEDEATSDYLDNLHIGGIEPSSPNRNVSLPDLRGMRAEKLLKSSKTALLVTRKEYLKKDWCKTEPLIQRIKEDGCLSRTIINRFCYGQCNSFYIPKSPKHKRKHNRNNVADSGEVVHQAFKSCAFCKPKKWQWTTLTLRCPSRTPQLRRKKVLSVKQCRCITEVLN